MLPFKFCKQCGFIFYKQGIQTRYQWENIKFCSKSCVTSYRWGTTGFARTSTSIEERFWRFVDKGDASSCWEWKGSTDGQGYGTLSSGKNKSPAKSHRLSWEMHFGKIPFGLVVCHSCDNPLCVNPSHLMVGTQMANVIDAKKKNRIKNGESHYMSRLTCGQVIVIRRKYKLGSRIVDLADKFGVSRSTIADAVNKKTWREI